MREAVDVVIVGTGFASSFFLQRYLAAAAPNQRILVLETGARRSHREQLEDGAPSSAEILARVNREIVNRNPEKIWAFTLGFGGSSNCWWGNTPRMLPADFRLKSRYGVGVDWPFDYDALEPFYCDAEDIMAISGPADRTPGPRSRPYPQPPHQMSEPDRRLAQAFPDSFFPMATARASRPTARRSRCCAASVCRLCPRNAKFTILNELAWLYDDPRVELRLGAKVTAVETAAGRASGVRYRMNDQDRNVEAGLVVLGANALFNAQILLSSGLSEGGVGLGLVEQVSRTVSVFLDGLDNFQGSTSHTGHGYMFYDGDRRRDRAAILVETSNTPELRHERGKWRQFLSMKFICEDLRQDVNTVRIAGGDPTKPEVTFVGHSDYATRALDAIEADAKTLVASLPVERIAVSRVNPGEAHIMGTTVMGTDAATSVVDGDCVHHRLRNLVVLGSGTFPTAAPANPTLTIAAVSLRAAARLQGTDGRRS
jgi:choline dehydrogenase-like flavoprotein